MPVGSSSRQCQPVPDELAERIGWRHDECLSSHRHTVDYLSRTEDGRILFGGRGAPYHFGSDIDPGYDRHEATHAELGRMLLDWFPELRDLDVTHAWGGPLGMPRDFMPRFHLDPDDGIAAAYGYTGQGVAASRLAGRVLTDLITTGDTPLRDLPMVGHRRRRWEPEPLRWLGARYVQAALTRIDRRAEETGEAPSGRSPTASTASSTASFRSSGPVAGSSLMTSRIAALTCRRRHRLRPSSIRCPYPSLASTLDSAIANSMTSSSDGLNRRPPTGR